MESRLAGFDPSIIIPLVVTQKSNIDEIVGLPRDIVIGLEFTAVSQEGMITVAYLPESC